MATITPRKGRKPLTFEPDPVQTAEALVAFYEKRLDEAYEQLGAAVAARDERQKGRKWRV